MSRPQTPRKTSKKRGSRPGRGTLFVIAGLLISSAIIRLGLDAGQAIARQSDATTVDEARDSARARPENCAPPPDVAAMLVAFQQRETRLKQREAQLRARIQALSVVDREISEKMAALTGAEEELRTTLALADSAAENDLGQLTSVYENMKPKDAAALFEAMDPRFSAGFLGRMRPEAAAAIMAGLTPQTAYTISAILAGRNADVPKE
ncbi:MotE family protein [Marimonas arenosa]|uniref:Flagellar motility protein MotE (MotC chaperone) n=1 Tax=Marimonas arenosa TaxID=1795305 RepID=A0AAE3WDT3_9RHOB|nr:hypothetical protein [Marimonas arenosa]MDQ2090570.1 hypothetical protein [Marimonas arenosa]